MPLVGGPPTRGPLAPLRSVVLPRSVVPALGMIDSFSGSAASALASPADNGGALTLTGGPTGNWAEGGGKGTCTPSSAGGTVRSWNLACPHKDGDYYIDFSFDTAPVGGSQIFFLWLRVQSTANLTDYGARIRVQMNVAANAQLGQALRVVGGVTTNVGPAAQNVPGDIAAGQLMRIHVYMEGGFYGVNVYDAASAEPAGWLASWTDTAGYIDGAAIAFGGQAPAGNTNLSPVQYDNLRGTVASAVPIGNVQLLTVSTTATNSTSLAVQPRPVVSVGAGNATSVLKVPLMVVSAGAANATSVLKAIATSVVRTAPSTPTVLKQPGKLVTTTGGNTTTVAKQPGKVVSASAGSTTTIKLLLGKLVSVSAATTTTVIKKPLKLVTVSAPSTITVNAIKVVLLAVTTAAAGSAITVLKMPLKLVSTSAGSTSTIAKLVGKLVSTTGTSTTTVLKLPKVGVTRTATSSALVRLVPGKLVQTAQNSTVSVKLALSKAITAPAASSVTLRLGVSKVASVAASSVALVRLRPNLVVQRTATSVVSAVAQSLAIVHDIYRFVTSPFGRSASGPSEADFTIGPGGRSTSGPSDGRFTDNPHDA